MPSLSSFEAPRRLRVIHLPKTASVSLRLFLRFEVLCLTLEAVLFYHPSPAVHDHFELDVTRHRTGPLHQAAAALALMVIDPMQVGVG